MQLSKASATVRRGAGAVLSPTGVRGAAVELAWLAAHAAIYPVGLRAERATEGAPHDLSGLSPIQRGLIIGDVEAAGTPILLVHGMIDNRTIFTVLRRSLRRRGFGQVRNLSYSPLTSDLRVAAERLAEQVESLCADTGFERVHVIGHSMGGIIARYYVQRLGGDARIHTLVTLGTPHGGTLAAYLWPSLLARQLRPGSEILAELEQPAPGCRTRFLAVWSDLDQLVVPKRSGRVDHPDLQSRNVLIRGVGHMSLPIHRGAVRAISQTLAHLGTDGATVTAGVTPIGSDRPQRAPTSGPGAVFERPASG